MWWYSKSSQRTDFVPDARISILGGNGLTFGFNKNQWKRYIFRVPAFGSLRITRCDGQNGAKLKGTKNLSFNRGYFVRDCWCGPKKSLNISRNKKFPKIIPSFEKYPKNIFQKTSQILRNIPKILSLKKYHLSPLVFVYINLHRK